MLGSRLFWKLYLTLAGLVVVTIGATGFLVHQQLRAALLEDVETRLVDMSTSLVPHAAEALSPFAERSARRGEGDAPPPPDTRRIQADLVRLGEQTETRITLVTAAGLVIADSDHDPATMENHGDRPEIVAARSAAHGVARRFSETEGQSLLYVAVAVQDEGRLVGTVRASIPLVDVDVRLAALRDTIVLGAGVGALFALGVGLFVARRISAPVARMTGVAEALRSGQYDQRVGAAGNDEFAVLGDTIDRLADELTRRIATLAGQKAQLGAMVAGLHEGVFAVDRRDRVILVNTAARRLLGLPDDLADAPLWEALSTPELRALCADAAASGSSTAGELALRRDGGELILEARATSFEAEGQQGVVVVLHDVTGLRRLERLRTEFVANVSHELKTPLTSIRGYVDTLVAGAVHDDAHNMRFLGKIEQHVERLTAMVSDLLSLARIEATEPRLATQPTDWRAVISAVVESFREAGKLAAHTVRVVLPEDALLVAGDVEAMTQVLDNLLDNAIKYTPEGGTVTVRAAARGGDAIVEVEDTGIGISADDRGRIFERFFRADRARSRDTGGTGLGLAIVKHLVQRLGGEMRVTSELGRGSNFAVLLPLDSSASSTNPAAPRPA